MSKIICDICGTSYPETAECCPICGCSRDDASDLVGTDLLQEEGARAKGGLFTARKKEIFDFDEVNAEPEEYEEEDEEDEEEDSYDEEEEEEETPRHNTFIVILLTILIAGLLIAAGFVFVRYFLPNMGGGDETAVQTTAAVEIAAETTDPTIPCETLIISSGMVAELNAEGQHFLLHIKAMPENTTDKIIYVSADESIATVTEDGKITAVSEGETTIYISCGKSSIECPVIINYVEETVPPTTEAAVETTVPAEEETTPVVVEAEDADAPAPVDPNVVLKLKKTDIMLGVYYQYTLELDCDLEQNEVQWSSEHPHIATVDENGVVTAVKSGTTAITAKYGDQEVQCMVRCG